MLESLDRTLTKRPRAVAHASMHDITSRSPTGYKVPRGFLCAVAHDGVIGAAPGYRHLTRRLESVMLWRLSNDLLLHATFSF